MWFSLRFAIAAVAATLLALPVHAQDRASEHLYGTGAGGQILLTNSGFGLGGYYQHALSPSLSFVAEAALRTGKHEREGTFVDFTGRRTIPDKANFLLMMPMRLGLQHRLFEDQIEDNFRPYVQLSGGPTFGWEYPYFDDCNRNGQFEPAAGVDCDGDGESDDREQTYDVISGLPHGSFRLGVGGLLALGAHFGESTRLTQGLRIGYTFHYFPDGIQLLQGNPEGAADRQRYFGSPVITLVFGRLF